LFWIETIQCIGKEGRSRIAVQGQQRQDVGLLVILHLIAIWCGYFAKSYLNQDKFWYNEKE